MSKIKIKKKSRKKKFLTNWIGRIVIWLYERFVQPKMIDLILPKGFMNVGISKDNNLTADNNNSHVWDDLNIPLPCGKWRIYKINGRFVELIKSTQ